MEFSFGVLSKKMYGRWIDECQKLLAVLAYGFFCLNAMAKAEYGFRYR